MMNPSHEEEVEEIETQPSVEKDELEESNSEESCQPKAPLDYHRVTKLREWIGYDPETQEYIWPKQSTREDRLKLPLRIRYRRKPKWVTKSEKDVPIYCVLLHYSAKNDAYVVFLSGTQRCELIYNVDEDDNVVPWGSLTGAARALYRYEGTNGSGSNGWTNFVVDDPDGRSPYHNRTLKEARDNPQFKGFVNKADDRLPLDEWATMNNATLNRKATWRYQRVLTLLAQLNREEESSEEEEEVEDEDEPDISARKRRRSEKVAQSNLAIMKKSKSICEDDFSALLTMGQNVKLVFK